MNPMILFSKWEKKVFNSILFIYLLNGYMMWLDDFRWIWRLYWFVSEKTYTKTCKKSFLHNQPLQSSSAPTSISFCNRKINTYEAWNNLFINTSYFLVAMLCSIFFFFTFGSSSFKSTLICTFWQQMTRKLGEGYAQILRS